MKLPFIISIPHCSADVPKAINDTLALDHRQIEESVDFGTQEIFGVLPAQETVKAQWSRLVVDLNRSPTQADAKGVVALSDYHGRPVYRTGMAPDGPKLAQRIAHYHQPYHAQLKRALGNDGAIGLIDGHSLNAMGPPDAPDPGQKRKDIILSNNGNIDGGERPGSGPITCSTKQIKIFKQCFEDQGLSVALNFPYQGGYIVNHYGKLMTATGRFAIQIEMNQHLYMQPDSVKPEPVRIHAVTQKVRDALEKITTILLQGEVS